MACENHAHQPLRYTQEVLLKEHAPGSFCMTPGRIVWELALYYGTHKGAFSICSICPGILFLNI